MITVNNTKYTFKKGYLLFFTVVIAMIVFLLQSCKKTDQSPVQVSQPHFLISQGVYLVNQSGNDAYSIGVSLDKPLTVETKVDIMVTSPTNAINGKQYSLTNSSATIPAGQTSGQFNLTADYTKMTPGQDDTLLLQLSVNGSTSTLKQVFTLVLRAIPGCPIADANDFLGVYANTTEIFGTGSPYGPYSTRVDSVYQTSATSAVIAVGNLYDAGWNNIKFKLDWSNPANYTVTLDTQTGIGDAGTLSSTYAGSDISVRPFAGQNGTITNCNGSQKIVLKMQLGVTGLGWFSPLYTVILDR